MHKLTLSALMLGVSFGCALGDVECYLTSDRCHQSAGRLSLSNTYLGSGFCANKDTLYNCVREKQKECSVEYNLNKLEAMADAICTSGTSLNKQLLNYRDCIQKSRSAHHDCYYLRSQYWTKLKNNELVSIVDIYKMVCTERNKVQQCFRHHVEMDCGKDAKTFIDIVEKPLDDIIYNICQDVWRLDSKESSTIVIKLYNMKNDEL